MAIRPKTQVGTMNCLCCGQEIPVKAGESGTLSFPCPWCDFPGYAKNGTEAHKIVKTTKMKPIAAAVVTPPAPAAKPQPATIFG